MSESKNLRRLNIIGVILIMLVALATSIYFGNMKVGFHEDEYYSFYSTNRTDGWLVPDGDWMTRDAIYQEFVVKEGQGFKYGFVKLIQSWDVHPPLFYWILHTVCSFTPEIFSKWQGLVINIVAYLGCIAVFFLCTRQWLDKDEDKTTSILSLLFTAVFALNPAIISAVMFIRMYSLLAFIIQLSLYVHIKAWKKQGYTRLTCLLPLAVIVYLGFMTHYYFLMFQFFLSAIFCVLILYKEKSLKNVIRYGITMIIPLGLGYLTYPSCLGQMFRGQRGAQATTNFFDLSNTFDRLSTFYGLINDYLFGGLTIVVILFVIVLFVVSKKDGLHYSQILMFGITILGYCFVISKTALILGDTSVRYILPIFGTVLSFLFYVIIGLMNKAGIVKKGCVYGFVIVMLAMNIFSVFSRETKVLFLYKEAASYVEYAKEHNDIPVMYIYAPSSSWVVWNSTHEFLEYPEVYFVANSTQDIIEDEVIASTPKLIAYIEGDSEEEIRPQIERVLCSNKGLTSYKIAVCEKFCQVVEFE